MPIYAGQTVTAGQLNRMQPTTYKAVQTSALVGPQSGADVPGASITLTTQAPNAVVVAHAVFDFDPSSTISALANGRLVIDGSGVGEYAVYQSIGATQDRQSTPQNYQETLAAAGSHTLKLITTIPASMTLNVYTTLIVTVYEVA